MMPFLNGAGQIDRNSMKTISVFKLVDLFWGATTNRGHTGYDGEKKKQNGDQCRLADSSIKIPKNSRTARMMRIYFPLSTRS